MQLVRVFCHNFFIFIISCVTFELLSVAVRMYLNSSFYNTQGSGYIQVLSTQFMREMEPGLFYHCEFKEFILRAQWMQIIPPGAARVLEKFNHFEYKNVWCCGGVL